MKRVAISYNDIVSIYRIKDVYLNIYKNTTHKGKLIKFELNKTSNISRIYSVLNDKSYSHLRYNVFIIREPKYRIIMSELMPDKIVNHLISKYVLLPSLIPKLIEQNVATRVGKGSKAGIMYMKRYINSIKENYANVYVLKCDISKYFYNINHKLLIDMLKKDIEDRDLLNVLINIINSTDYDYINELIDTCITKEINYLKKCNNNDLAEKMSEVKSLPRYIYGKGLPIGNETSQILAIYYLNSLDHFIKEKLHIKYYIRYMDDFILIHQDKRYLEYCLRMINKRIRSLDLRLNKKTQIYNLRKGVNFLGYKFLLRNKKLIVLFNNKTKKRIKRKLRGLKVKDFVAYNKSLASYNGYFIVSSCRSFSFKNKFCLE